jgi:multimeric flavodoxin WrbA
MDNELLIVYHSQSGVTESLARAVESGAEKVKTTAVRRLHASAVTGADLLGCRAVVICSPEYFGYMAGAIKDMFDRTYDELRDSLIGKPYAVVISAGNDGLGALNSVERIVAGWKLRRVQEPLLFRGEVTTEDLSQCEELGETLAAGIDLGIY